MNEDRLSALLEAYGAAPERWPAEERADGLALLARSDRARQAWVAAAALDTLMVPAPAPSPSADLVERLQAIPQANAAPRARPRRRPSLASFLGSVRLSAAGAFAAVVLAFLGGLALPTPFGGAQTETAVLAIAETDGNEILLGTTDGNLALVDDWFDEVDEVEETDTEESDLAFLDLPLE